MKVKMILPALTEATSPYWRSIKYSLFPPLGLATLAGYLKDDDEVALEDEHVEPLHLDDTPDLVALEVYVTSAHRAYEIADHYRKRGVPVAMGGLHVTSMPHEAAQHADHIFLGPGEDSWPRFLSDFRAGRPRKVYRSVRRTLEGMPRIRRDLIKDELYFVPNSLIVSRGCPHQCDFCYKHSFFRGGKSYYRLSVKAALSEIARLRGRHLFFLDDNLFADRAFAEALFEGMTGMGRVWQAAGTVAACLDEPLIKKAAASGLRSLFIGFETLNEANLKDHNKFQNLQRDYGAAIRILHDNGVMINGSFIFGMDSDDPSVFDRTVAWAVENNIETATFHILTPYPGTELYRRLDGQGRILHNRWDLYDTRHVVFRPAKMSPATLLDGYGRAYKNFYAWGSILQGALAQPTAAHRARHFAYATGWKKCEPVWDFLIRHRQLGRTRGFLEAVLSGKRRPQEAVRSLQPGPAEARLLRPEIQI